MDIIDELFGRGMFNHLISQMIAMGITIFILPGLWITGILGAFLILGGVSLVNAFIWDAALFYSIPQTLSIVSVQLFVANGLIFWILVKLLPGIEVKGILPAIFAPILFAVLSGLIHKFAGNVDWVGLIILIFYQIIEIKNYLLTVNSSGAQ